MKGEGDIFLELLDWRKITKDFVEGAIARRLDLICVGRKATMQQITVVFGSMVLNSVQSSCKSFQVIEKQKRVPNKM